MNRCFQSLLIASTICLSWLSMMAVHEFGHVLNGWISGARLEGVRLPLVGFSQTEFANNPHPLFVVWGGPIWGCLLPLAIFGGVKMLGTASGAARRYGFLARWFAGFCLVANGGYLAGGVFLCHGGGDDPSVVLLHGGAMWQLLAFGLPAIAAGLYLWNGLGAHFGLGASGGEVDRKVAFGTTVALAIVAVAIIAFGKTNNPS